MKTVTNIIVRMLLKVIVICPLPLFADPSSDLKALLAPVVSIHGHFSQKVMNEKGTFLQEAKGSIQLKKPGKFRWEIQGKEPRWVIANGQKVWDYDKELEQVTIQKFSKSQGSAPIFFLTGDIQSLEKDFTIKNISHEAGHCLSASDRCFELEPKISQGSFQWIRVGFKNKKLQEMELLDQLGQHCIFIFKDIILNANIPDNVFQFIPPKGVDVVENS